MPCASLMEVIAVEPMSENNIAWTVNVSVTPSWELFHTFIFTLFQAEILFRISFEIHYEYLSIKSYNHLYLDFKCSTIQDCHGRGFCDESGTCQCNVNWDWMKDCSGKFLLCLHNKQKV